MYRMRPSDLLSLIVPHGENGCMYNMVTETNGGTTWRNGMVTETNDVTHGDGDKRMDVQTHA